MEGNQLVEEMSAAMAKGRRMTKRKLLSIPPIRRNPVCSLLIDTFTVDGEVRFEEMMEELRAFVSAGPLKRKLTLLFKIYDRQRMARIGSSDLFGILKQLNSQGLKDQDIHCIVDKTYAELGAYRDWMDYGEFTDLIVRKTRNLEAFFKVG
jgi:Ca2+-binding EF-hand superfamily protein